MYGVEIPTPSATSSFNNWMVSWIAQITISANIILKIGLRRKCFRMNKSHNVRNLLPVNFMKAVMKNLPAGCYICDYGFRFVFFQVKDVATLRSDRRKYCSIFQMLCVPLPERTILFTRLEMPGLPALGDDLNAILFEFLDDDTKLGRACMDWLYVQHWYTVVQEPTMRVTFSLMGAGDNCGGHLQDIPPRSTFFPLVLLYHAQPLRRWRAVQCPASSSRTTVSILAFCFIHCIYHQTTAAAGASLRRCGTLACLVKCVTQLFPRLQFRGRFQCKHPGKWTKKTKTI